MRIQNYPLMITISPKAEEAFSNLLSFTTRHSRIQTLSHSLSISLSVTAAFLFHTFSHSLSPNTTKTLFYHYIYAYISVCLFICFTKPKISCTWKFICSFSSVSNTLCVALFNALRFYNKSLKQSINIYLVSLTFLGAVLNFSVGRQEEKKRIYMNDRTLLWTTRSNFEVTSVWKGIFEVISCELSQHSYKLLIASRKVLPSLEIVCSNFNEKLSYSVLFAVNSPKPPTAY